MDKIDNTRIKGSTLIDTAKSVSDEIKLSKNTIKTVSKTRQEIDTVLDGQDDRLVVIVGPCSIHDPKVAMEYAHQLLACKKQFKDDLIIVMRVYFEKPRTTIGWKGLINDPYLDNSFKINDGIRLARSLLRDINELGLPAATEFLDLISPQYLAELISWGAIGARTTESQGHRELASGLSCPVGFKNGTNGNLQIAIDAIKAASKEHHFLSLSKEGNPTIYHTTGNEYCHLILRGGVRPNYDKKSVSQAIEDLQNCNTQNKLMIDFSHANSDKDYQKQTKVSENVAQQIERGNQNIMGVMIESNLVAGRQDLNNPKELIYGQSITDGCVDFGTTEKILKNLAKAVQKRRKL